MSATATADGVLDIEFDCQPAIPPMTTTTNRRSAPAMRNTTRNACREPETLPATETAVTLVDYISVSA
jgi:hypothetical protein